MRYQIKRTQQLYCDMDRAWNFFSAPGNLSVITPADIDFTIRQPFREEPIYQGMTIDYIIRPLWSIPIGWRTLISQVDTHKSFTDIQLRGPYKYWKHYHTFQTNPDGVLMTDLVEYELPLSFIGRWMHVCIVRNKLEYIFNFRYKVLEELFGNMSTV